MNYINKIVLVFCSLLLVILLILLVINLNSNKYKFAPVISDCPDYWETTTDANNNIVCLNTHNLGNNSQGCYFPKLVYKKNEIDTMFQEQTTELDRIGREKDELNKLEESVRYELSGLHGARVVLDQLINENSVKTKQETEDQ